MWSNDQELFSLMREKLFTAVVGDILDGLGYYHQFLPPEVRPLRDDMIVAGRAMPVLELDLQPNHPPDRPFGLMLDALDDLRPGEVYLAAGCSPTFALWGELMSTRAMRLGCTGAVLHGASRDTRGILRLNFPTFSTGRFARDQRSRGHVVDFRTAIEIGRTRIAPGDIILGDIDGVVIVPRSAERDVLMQALEKVEKENLVRLAIENGMSAGVAFRTYGVM